MPTFKIELSNGAVYEIDGPEGASEKQLMTTLAESLDPVDASVLRSKNDDFGEFLRTRAQEPKEGESAADRSRRLFGEIPLPEVSPGQGSARAALQGATFGTGDEIVGAGAAGLDALTGKTPDQTLGELYTSYLARERDKIGGFRESNPVLATGAEIAGALPTALLTAGGGAGASLGARALAGGGVGAGQGALYGFNAGEGGAGNRLQSAAFGGAVGGALGAAAPAVGAGARNLYNATIGGARAAKQAGVSRPAFNLLSDVVDADNPAGPASSRALLGERGPTATGAVDFLAQRPGPSQRIVRDAVAGRVGEATSQVGRALDDTLGAAQGARGVGRQIARSTSGAREAAYNRAYGAVIDYADDAGQRVEGVLRRVPRRVMGKAVQSANEAMQADGVLNQQITATTKDGALEFVKKPNVQQLDYIKRALGEIGASEVDNFGRPTGAGLRANSLARDLRGALGRAVPEYNEAVRLGGDKIARDNGLRLGGRLLSARTTREEVREFVTRFGPEVPEDVLEAMRTGLRSNIDDTLANVRRTMQDPNVDAREAAKAVKDLSSRANREKISLVLGDSAQELFDQIDDAAQAFNLQAATIQNSKTAVRQMFNDRLNPPGGAVENAMQGRPLEAGRDIVKALTGRTDEALRAATDAQAAELARALTQSGEGAQHLLGQVQRGQQVIAPRAANIQGIAERLLRGNTGVAGPIQGNLR